jgi:hypothetical protein
MQARHGSRARGRGQATRPRSAHVRSGLLARSHAPGRVRPGSVNPRSGERWDSNTISGSDQRCPNNHRHFDAEVTLYAHITAWRFAPNRPTRRLRAYAIALELPSGARCADFVTRSFLQIHIIFHNSALFGVSYHQSRPKKI